MTNPDTTSPPASASPAPVRPGYKTSEFWLKLAAIALSAVFASGAITNSTALAIAGIAASVLTAMGYTVSRTLVKTAGTVLLIVLAVGAASTLTACGGKPTVINSGQTVVDCIELDAGKIATVAGELARTIAAYQLADTPIDWDALEARAESVGLSIGGCAFGPIVAKYVRGSTTSALVTTVPEDVAPARAAFERLRAKVGGARFRDASSEF